MRDEFYDSSDPRNADNTLDLQYHMGEMMANRMLGVFGQTYQHVQTGEKKIGDFRRDRLIFFQGDETAYRADDWQVTFPEKL